MDVVFVSIDDWASVGAVYAECLGEVGVNARSLCLRTHPFEYRIKSEVVDKKRMQALAGQARVVVFMHTAPPFWNPGLRWKRVVVFHGGSKYRLAAPEWNVFWNDKVDLSMIQTADLMGLGAKNQVLMPLAVDTKSIRMGVRPRGDKHQKIVIAHFPRHHELKGTSIILRTMRELGMERGQFLHENRHVTWTENLDRMSKCDVYVESQQYAQMGVPLGEWGMTALEAAALGKVVVTCFFSKREYEREFGKCPIVAANSEDELLYELGRLVEMDGDGVDELKRETRQWVERNHS